MAETASPARPDVSDGALATETRGKGATRPAWRALLPGIALLAVAVEAVVLRTGKIPWTSDQGIVALMARHMSRLEHWPLFCYGSSYGGTLEPTFTAILFSLLGPTVLSYRISMVLLLAILVLGTAATARLAFGERAGLVAALYLAVPPYFFLMKGLTSDGAYDTLAILGAVLLYASLRFEAAVRSGRRTRPWPFVIGLSAGLGWWVHPVFLYFYPAVVGWLLLVTPSAARRFRDAAIALGGFLLGLAPWLAVNLSSGWPSLRIPEARTLPARDVSRQLFLFWSEAVDVLLGGRPFYGYRHVFPGSRLFALALFAGVFLFAVVLVVRNRGQIRSAGGDPAARPALLAILTILSMQALVSLSARTYESDPRFLFPLYVPFAMLLGLAFVRLAGRRPRAAPAVGLAVFAFSGVSLVAAPPHDRPEQASTGSLRPLIRVLDARGLRDVYSGYWVSYRLAFESRERIYAAAFGEQGMDRYPLYYDRVRRSPDPAVVLASGDAARFRSYLSRRRATAREIRVDSHVVFWALPASVVQEIGTRRKIPE